MLTIEWKYELIATLKLRKWFDPFFNNSKSDAFAYDDISWFTTLYVDHSFGRF